MSEGKHMKRYYYAYALFSTEGTETANEELHNLRENLNDAISNRFSHIGNLELLDTRTGRCHEAKDNFHAHTLTMRDIRAKGRYSKFNHINKKLKD